MDKNQILTYIQQLFQYYYKCDGDTSHINTIIAFIQEGKLNIDTLPLYIESLSKDLPEYKLINKTPEHIKNKALSSTNNNIINNTNSNNLNNNNNNNKDPVSPRNNNNSFKYYNKDTNTFNKELIKQNLNSATVKIYVDELYLAYTGKLGDPASTHYLIKSIMDNSLSVPQAELHVKFSKEAKAYLGQVQIKENKRKKAEEYIYELFKLYFGKDYLVPLDDLHYFSSLIVEEPNPDYQAIEDEIKEKAILNVVIPSKKPFK
ncbi:hypothetical protein DICPUDRAFT_31270 [Dictyostelium purpureum]|uniref:Uncharacterized protein n=1 Tax=Dictyostelium purpureum TaxID=5786 RepID=F0ZGX7_DICPU|nr:uncharacterized protein DICPUDRAFT_31270 [Dictyostelium purpureum]EGC36811.1 hypothetical protein DICPUDRAFT_31270 [Dictyostelium purpureum]|eukprot:XP_003286682.1 hypothetical protein DICPUDRAFT_31270 [Dictyostelium purpureum]